MSQSGITKSKVKKWFHALLNLCLFNNNDDDKFKRNKLPVDNPEMNSPAFNDHRYRSNQPGKAMLKNRSIFKKTDNPVNFQTKNSYFRKLKKQSTMFLSLKNLNEGGEEALYNSNRHRVFPEGSNPKIPFEAMSSDHRWQNLQRHYQPNRKWEKLRK